MVHCAVKGCNNFWSKKKKGQIVKFFTFPKDEKIRKQWIDACGKKNKNPKSPRICSEHFLEEDYRLQDILLKVPKEKKHLKKDAIPTKNLPGGCSIISLGIERCIQQNEKQFVEDYLNCKDKNNFDEFDQSTNSIEVDKNNDIQKSFDVVYEYDSFSPNEENAKEIGIQCNLYVELLKDKFKTIEFKECSCYIEILNIIDSFNPIDTNLELLQNEIESNISMDKQFIENENDIDSTYLDYEELYLSDENNVKWSDFENISNNDSSDYGLTDFDSTDFGSTELPFPEIPELQIKTNSEDHTKLYECTVCKKDFKSYYIFDMHYTKFHAERSQLCSVCGRIKTNFNYLVIHEYNCNPNDNPYCYECKRGFKSKINYFDHCNMKHEKKSPYVCCCKKSFKAYTVFVLHLNKNHCGTIDMCTIPDYTTKEFLETFLELKGNKDNKNTDISKTTEEKKLRFWCRICKKNFLHHRAYMLHFRQELHMINEKEWLEEYCIEKVFECELCDKKLSELIDLVEHRAKYHRRQTLSDYIKNFEHGSNVQDQPILITQPTDFSNIYSYCHICKRKFFMQDFKLHFKIREHEISEKKWLAKHNIIVFNCTNCSIEFGSLLDYLIHKNSEHNEWPTNALIKSIKGDTNNSIPDYIQDKNNPRSIYKCSICNEYTKYKKVHIEHMLQHYPEKYVTCSCGKQYSHRNSLLHHRMYAGCQIEGCIIPRFILQSASLVFIVYALFVETNYLFDIRYVKTEHTSRQKAVALEKNGKRKEKIHKRNEAKNG